MLLAEARTASNGITTAKSRREKVRNLIFLYLSDDLGRKRLGRICRGRRSKPIARWSLAATSQPHLVFLKELKTNRLSPTASRRACNLFHLFTSCLPSRVTGFALSRRSRADTRRHR